MGLGGPPEPSPWPVFHTLIPMDVQRPRNLSQGATGTRVLEKPALGGLRPISPKFTTISPHAWLVG